MKLYKLAIIGIIASLFLMNCSSDNDDSGNIIYGNLAIIRAESDNIQPLGKTTKINVYYNTTNTCQSFEGLVAKTDSIQYNIYEVAVAASSRVDNSCRTETTERKDTYYFNPRSAGVNIIKMWNGKSAEGVDKFIRYEVTIPQD